MLSHFQAHAVLFNPLRQHRRKTHLVSLPSGEWRLAGRNSLFHNAIRPPATGSIPGYWSCPTQISCSLVRQPPPRYELAPSPRRLSEDSADVGFWSWAQHGETVLMSAELELAAWSSAGRKLWSTFVEHRATTPDGQAVDEATARAVGYSLYGQVLRYLRLLLRQAAAASCRAAEAAEEFARRHQAYEPGSVRPANDLH